MINKCFSIDIDIFKMNKKATRRIQSCQDKKSAKRDKGFKSHIMSIVNKSTKKFEEPKMIVNVFKLC